MSAVRGKLRWGAPTLPALLLVWLGCGGEPAPAPAVREGTSPEDVPDGHQVIARVAQQPITVPEVSEVVRATGLEPRQALRRLIEERLLAHEAEGRGYGAAPGVEPAARNAAAHALLARRVEQASGDEQVSQAEVTRRVEALADKRAMPERRGADHVLFQVEADADPELDARAQHLAEQAVAALRDSADPKPVFEAYLQQPLLEGVTVTVEKLPPVPRNGTFARPFEQALFELPGRGAVSEPVRTKFGWHALVLRELAPAEKPTPAELEREVRAAMRDEGRRKRLDALLEELRERIPVQVLEHGLASVLSAGDAQGPRE